MINPIGDKIIITPAEKRDKTASGIYLAGDDKQRLARGTVIATGPGRLMNTGATIPLEVKQGDEIIYNKMGEIKIKDDDDTEYVMIGSVDVFGIVV